MEPRRLLISHQMWKDLLHERAFREQRVDIEVREHIVRIPLPEDVTTSLLRRIGCVA